MSILRMVTLVAVTLVALQASAASPSSTSGPYRGPMNNGVYPATGLLKTWPTNGPPLLWKARLGEGYASVVVADGAVYTSSGGSGALRGYTLDGEEKFSYGYGQCVWARFNGSRSTPLLRDGTAVVTRVNADVIGIDLKTGESKWTVNAWKGFGTGKGSLGWGYSCTPAIFEGKVILNPISRDDETPPIVAVDIATGKTVWQADAGKGKRYSGNSMSGVVFSHNGRTLSVNPTWRYTLCLDPADGTRLWEIPEVDTNKGCTKSMSPVYAEGYLLLDRAGTTLCVKLSKDGTAYTPLWARPHDGFGHAVILNSRVYIAGSVADPIWRGAEAISLPKVSPLVAPRQGKDTATPPSLPSGLLCLDAETGEALDCLRMPDGLGHVVAADGMVYAQDFQRSPESVRGKWEEGVSQLGINVYLLHPTGAGMDIAGHFRLPMGLDDAKQVKELEYQANIVPVIAEGRLFIRYGPLWVYDLRPGKEPRPTHPQPAPTAGLWDLRLKGFFDGNRELLMTLRVASNAVVSAIAAAPAWNRALHSVDAKDMKVADGGLAGTLTATMNPDASIPADKKSIARNIELRVRHENGRLTGTYTGGLVDGTQVAGRLSPGVR